MVSVCSSCAGGGLKGQGEMGDALEPSDWGGQPSSKAKRGKEVPWQLGSFTLLAPGRGGMLQLRTKPISKASRAHGTRPPGLGTNAWGCWDASSSSTCTTLHQQGRAKTLCPVRRLAGGGSAQWLYPPSAPRGGKSPGPARGELGGGQQSKKPPRLPTP